VWLVHNGGLGMSGDGPPSTCHGVPPEDMDEWISTTPIGSGFVGIMSETGMGSGPPYTLDGVALAPRQCIRSFQLTADGRAITHQNHYRSADGRQETKTFGPYTPATTRGVFVEASFSWGPPAVAGATPFAFETGFRAAERRVSLVIRSDAHGGWQPFVVITEHLGRWAERPPAVEIPALLQGCRGLRRTITPDLRVSPAEPIAWCRLEEVGEDRLMVRVPGWRSACHIASLLGSRGWASWSGRWRPRRCTWASGRTRRRGLPSSASTSLPPNTSGSRTLCGLCNLTMRQVPAHCPKLSGMFP
jgi:uncharacterized protein DUF3598